MIPLQSGQSETIMAICFLVFIFGAGLFFYIGDRRLTKYRNTQNRLIELESNRLKKIAELKEAANKAERERKEAAEGRDRQYEEQLEQDFQELIMLDRKRKRIGKLKGSEHSRWYELKAKFGWRDL